MKPKDLMQKVKEAVLEMETNAEILLYGSRARGDSIEQSDWDFLILLDGNVDDHRTDKIRHRLYELEWELGEVISSIIRNKDEWNSMPFKTMPIYHAIEKEGIRL
ncbi:MAG: nucleotidyltransferase domain-containing protein [Desulfobacterales bacterium]|jgi:predicted nucleotidyltransferase